MDADVAIVGAGPVGLLLAAELCARDVRTVVLERSLQPDGRLRAPAITERTIEVLERHGLLERLVDETARYRARHGATSDTLSVDLRMSGVRALPIRQDLVEQVLEEHVHELGVEVRRGAEVVGLSLGDAHVDLRLRDRDGRSRRLSASFAVGCDGGHSTVRRAAGIAFPGTGATCTGYQAEATLGDPAALPRGWQRTPAGVVAYELCPSRIVSIEFAGPPADRAAPVTLEEVQASVRRTSGTDVTLHDARSLTRFTDNARIAADYRRGRVLLAGDAAHVHAPLGGQGLNLGMQDAANLGWKLAATVEGSAPPGLLDTYARERRPVAAQVLETVQAAGALLHPDPRLTAAYELFRELRGLEQVRRHLHEKTAMVHVRYDVGAVESDCPLLGRAPRGMTIRSACGESDDWSRSLRPGRGLLVAPAAAECVDTAVPWRDRVDVVEGDLADATGVRAVLLRPDGYAVWVADRDDARQPALGDALARWFGPPLATVHELAGASAGDARGAP